MIVLYEAFGEVFFSVEGETEMWYLQWLSNVINNCDAAKYKASFNCKIEKDPVSRAKGLSNLQNIEITHVFDRESEEEFHSLQFDNTLQRMKKAQELGKKIKYSLGYSNFSFELWIILHKLDCTSFLNHRRQYLSLINNAYQEQFTKLDEYKKESNFKRILGKLTLQDVWAATDRADKS